MGWSNHYHKQQQARQLREIERNTALAAGVQPRKLTWAEKNVMGVKDPMRPNLPMSPGAQSFPSPQAHIAYLEGRVNALEARVQWLIDVVEDERSRQAPPPPPPPPPPIAQG